MRAHVEKVDVLGWNKSCLSHILWGIENHFIIVLSLYRHSLNLSLALKGEFLLYISRSVYIHFVLDSHITIGMVNKIIPTQNISDGYGGTTYLEPARYIYMQTPYVQAVDDPSWDLAPLYVYS